MQKSRKTAKVVIVSLSIILMAVLATSINYLLKNKEIERQIDTLLTSPVPAKIDKRSQLASCIDKRIQLWGKLVHCKGSPGRYLLIYGKPNLRIDLEGGEELSVMENVVISGTVTYYFEPYLRRCYYDTYNHEKKSPDYLRFMLLCPKEDQATDRLDNRNPDNFCIKETQLKKDNHSYKPSQSQDTYLELRDCLKYLIQTGQ